MLRNTNPKANKSANKSNQRNKSTTKRQITTKVQRKVQNKSLRPHNKNTTSPLTTRKQHYALHTTIDLDAPINYRFVNPRRNVSVLGVPFAFGQPLQGVDRAPAEMRLGGLIERITNEQWKVNDHGDIAVEQQNASNATNPENDIKGVVKGRQYFLKSPTVVSKICHDTAKVTAEHTANGDFMLTLGGDHSIAMGTIAGILKGRPETGIIWVDAHADINTPFTTPSGNIHGMPVSFLMKHPDTTDLHETFNWLKDYPQLDPRKIVYIGLRDLEQGERNIIKEYGIKAFSMQDVDRYGIGNIMDKAIRHLTNDRRVDIPIHLSLDIDGVDPLFAPSTGTRVFGGLSYREAYYICEAAAETGMLSSMDLVEVNPTLGNNDNDRSGADRTIKIANGLIAAALGNRIL